MKLAVVAFPNLEDTDRRWIESFRAEHDPQASRVAVHFTLVFPVEAPPDAVAAEIAAVARSTDAIRFTSCRAEVVVDAFGHGSHVFLVPDEGAFQISTLHDRLYAGTLNAHRRSDIPFVPHMTVGLAPDSASAVGLAKRLDASARSVRGNVDAVELLDVGASRVRSVASFKLATGNAP